MKVAHADDQPTLVGVGDTQQIREIGPPTDERVAPAKQSKVDWLILGGIAIAVVLAAGALGMGLLSYVRRPTPSPVLRGQRGCKGRRGLRESKACLGHKGLLGQRGQPERRGQRGSRACRVRPAPPGRLVLGDPLVRPEQLERAARSLRVRQHRERRCCRQSTRLWARASPRRRPVLRVSLPSEVVPRFRHRVSLPRALRCGPRTQRAPTDGGPWDL